MKLYDVCCFFVSLAIVAIGGVFLACAGCASAPVWERAKLTCLDYANAASREALTEDCERPAGVIIHTFPGESDRHATMWVREGGETIYYDAINNRNLRREELGTIHWQVVGPSRGAWDVCPMPGEGKK